MRIPLDLEDPREMSDHLKLSRPSSECIMSLRRLTAAATQLDFIPSLVESRDVTNIVIVIVTDISNEQLLAAVSDRLGRVTAKDLISNIH